MNSLYAAATIGLVLFDLDFRYVRLNSAIAEMNGVPVSEHIGKTPYEIVPAIARDAEAVFRKVIATDAPVRFEIRGLTPGTGSVERVWDEHWYPVHSNGKLFGVGAVVEDITERKRMEQERLAQAAYLESALEQRTREVIAANESMRRTEAMAVLGALAGGIAHDLTNLLLPIRVRLNMLERIEVSPGVREHVQAIGESVQYIHALSQRIRSYMSDAGRHDMAMSGVESVNLAEWCRRTVRFLKSILPLAAGRDGAAPIGLECYIPENLPALSVNKTALTQAIYNLVQNSVKAMIRSCLGEQIVLCAFQTHHTDVSIAVIDDGPGMTQEVLERCLDPRFTTDAEGGNLGLGLALVKAFADSCGAKLDILSPPPRLGDQPPRPRGTAVVITFPSSIVCDKLDP